MYFGRKITYILFIIMFNCSNSFAELERYNESTMDYYPNYSADADQCSEISDPYEKVNRKIFAFNSFLDYVLLRPVAKSYKILIPDFTKDKIGNFIDNLGVPVTVVNNILQMRLRDTVAGAWKFIINTTVGIGGIFDVATKVGVHSEPQTFGSTLARYGVKSGPYIVVPFFGASNGRDITDIFVLSRIDPVKYNMNKYQRNGYTAASMIHKRSEILEVTDMIARESADPYAAIRSMVHQKRESTLRYPKQVKKNCRSR